MPDLEWMLTGEKRFMTNTQENHTEAGQARNGRKTGERLREWLGSPACRCTLLVTVSALIIFVMFFLVCTPKKYDLKEGAVAHETIWATRDVVDEVRTQERRETAAAKTEIQYIYSNVKQDVMASLESAFDELRSIQRYGEQLRLSEPGRGDRFTEDEIEYATIEYLNSVPLSGNQIRILMKTNYTDFENMVSIVTKAVSIKMNSNLYEGQTEELIKVMVEDFNAYYPELDIEMRMNDIIPTILRECIRPNYIIDTEATERARSEAMDSVDPVTILQGEPVIVEGNTITNAQIQVLRSLNLLKDGTYDYSAYGGSLAAVILSMAILIMCLKLLNRDILTDVRKLAVVLLILILCMILAAVFQLLPSSFLIPLALGSILGTMLIGYRAGICLTLALTLLISFLTAGRSSSTFHEVVLLMAMALTEGTLSIWFLKGRPQRVRVLIAGLLSGIAGVLQLLIVKWLTSVESLDILADGAWTLGGGLLSGLLAVSLQPAFEGAFRLATPSRLLELTNPNQPLMKRLMIEAAGTYHHSIIVANLAEAAADRIQANPYLARAGAYYHDIGKLKRPGYFKENQTGDNPHERTDPYISAAIVTSHTMDGVLLAQKEHIPEEVQNIILQHHGDTPVMFFYHKALQMSDGNHVDINEFRYAGPKPNTKEAAVVMLADTIEAAVRSMKDPTPKEIDQFIERLVRSKLEDGQLSESPLSLSDIDEICKAFSGILRGVYHERIEYPTVRHYVNPNGTVQDIAVPQSGAQAASPGPEPAVPAPEETEQPPEGPARTAGKPENAAVEGTEDEANDEN